MKSYTDLEQSKKLAEILPLESADMVLLHEEPYETSDSKFDGLHQALCVPFNKYDKSWRQKYKNISYFPCWSLSALLGLMPTDDKKDEYYVDTESHSDYHTVSYRNCWDGCIHSEYSEESLLDAAFEMICWLKENRKI